MLDKQASTRLGGSECIHGDICEQQFFRQLHWEKLERRQLQPPFRPQVVRIYYFAKQRQTIYKLFYHITHDVKERWVTKELSAVGPDLMFFSCVFQRHPLDTQYFDKAFTGERARLTPVENNILRSMDQTAFRGFSYTNPNATDHWGGLQDDVDTVKYPTRNALEVAALYRGRTSDCEAEGLCPDARPLPHALRYGNNCVQSLENVRNLEYRKVATLDRSELERLLWIVNKKILFNIFYNIDDYMCLMFYLRKQQFF